MVIIYIVILIHSSSNIAFAAQSPKKHKNITFDMFEEGVHSSFLFNGSSSIDLGALQLTPDTKNEAYKLSSKSGRIMYNRPFRLWLSDDTDNDVASFNTSFAMNNYRNKEWPAGEGLAFLIAPDHIIPENSHGQWLGLTNDTIDGDTTNHIVAIEFDSKKQEEFDPDGDHIGLNINSVRSKTTVPLNESGFDLAPDVDANYSVWIDYNGTSKVLEVYMARYVLSSVEKPAKPLLKETINLKDFVKEESYFGFAASTGSPDMQLNCILKWDLEVDDLRPRKDLKSLKIGLGLGVPAVLVLALCGVKLGLVSMKKRKRASDEESIVLGTLKRLPGIPREFKYRDLKKATKNFNDSMKLGQGGFGVVYRGILHEKANDSSTDAASTVQIAVKKFSRDNVHGKDDFFAELAIIHRLRHKHLVRLLGNVFTIILLLLHLLIFVFLVLCFMLFFFFSQIIIRLFNYFSSTSFLFIIFIYFVFLSLFFLVKLGGISFFGQIRWHICLYIF